MTKGLLHTLNYAEAGSVEYTCNCASIKNPNDLMWNHQTEFTYWAETAENVESRYEK